MKVYKSFLTYQIEFSVGLVSSHSVGAIAAIFYDVILLCEDVWRRQRTHGEIYVDGLNFPVFFYIISWLLHVKHSQMSPIRGKTSKIWFNVSMNSNKVFLTTKFVVMYRYFQNFAKYVYWFVSSRRFATGAGRFRLGLTLGLGLCMTNFFFLIHQCYSVLHIVW